MITQLLNKIDCYLHSQCTHQDLEKWLVSNLQDILDYGDKRAIELSNEIDADLVQLGEGLLDEPVFRKHLSGMRDSLTPSRS